MSERPSPWIFDDFEPGSELASTEFPFAPALQAGWSSIFEWSSQDRPAQAGPLFVLMMQAYVQAAQPRPAGNIHAGQRITFHGAVPADGASVSARVTCRAKELRGERRWVTFGVELSANGTPLMSGEMKVIWAA